MSEFDEKLNALLSNPDSMAQIMQLAQSLSGQAGGNPAEPSEREPSRSAYSGGASPAEHRERPDDEPLRQGANRTGNSAPNSPPSSGAYTGAEHTASAPFPPRSEGPAFNQGASQSAGGISDALSALTGGLDPKLLARLLPLLRELGSEKDGNASRLLYALRPYLKQERQDKVERALQLARLIHIGKKFLADWEG